MEFISFSVFYFLDEYIQALLSLYTYCTFSGKQMCLLKHTTQNKTVCKKKKMTFFCITLNPATLAFSIAVFFFFSLSSYLLEHAG